MRPSSTALRASRRPRTLRYGVAIASAVLLLTLLAATRRFQPSFQTGSRQPSAAVADAPAHSHGAPTSPRHDADANADASPKRRTPDPETDVADHAGVLTAASSHVRRDQRSSAANPYCANVDTDAPFAIKLSSLELPHHVDGPKHVDVAPWGHVAHPRHLSFGLDGFSPVQAADAAAISKVPVAGGFHCLVARDTGSGCIAATQPFVITEASRGGTEYAVPASFLRRLPFRVAVPLRSVDGSARAVGEAQSTINSAALAHQSTRGSLVTAMALSTTYVRRGSDPATKTTASSGGGATDPFRTVASQMAKDAATSTSRSHIDATLRLRYTLTVPRGTLGVALLTAHASGAGAGRAAGSAAKTGRRWARSARSAAAQGADDGSSEPFDGDAKHTGRARLSSNIASPYREVRRDFLRLFVRSVTTAAPGTSNGVAHATEAGEWAVDLFGGRGVGLLRGPQTSSRASWLPEHETLPHPDHPKTEWRFLVEQHASSSARAPGGGLVHDDAEAAEDRMAPEAVARDVVVVPLSEFIPVGSASALETALASEACRVAKSLDAPFVASRCYLHVTAGFEVIADVTVLPAGTVVASASGVMLKVSGRLVSAGSADAPVFFTRATEMEATGAEHNERTVHSKNWGGISVRHGGNFTADHTIFAFAGGSTKRAKGTGTHIKDACPIIVAEAGSIVNVADSALVHSRGPGIGAGEGAKVHIAGSVFHDLAQGGECVGCTIAISDTTFANFMLRPVSKAFVDKDNDGFYFRGGHASVERSVFANMLDDCIDTASSKGDQTHSTLNIRDSVIANCQHEGLALSASVGTKRSVKLSNTLVAWAQQGIENGYTPHSHDAEVSRVTFLGNELGLRYGDNYDLDVKGRLSVRDSVFRNNAVDVLNAIKKTMRRASKVAVPPSRDHGEFSTVVGATNVVVGGSAFVQPSAQALKAAPAGKAVGGGRGAVTRVAPEDTAFVFPRAGLGWSTAVPSEGVFCGLQHYISEGNGIVDVADIADEPVGCTSSPLCELALAMTNDGAKVPHA